MNQKMKLEMFFLQMEKGYTVAHLIEALLYSTSRKVADAITSGITDCPFRLYYGCGAAQALTELSTREFPGV